MTHKKQQDRIIVVDNSPPNLAIVCGIFKKLGFDTIQFQNAQDALKFIASLTDDELRQTCAVFSEYTMPKMTGLTLLQKLRTDKRTRSLPFVLMSSSDDPYVICHATTLGSNGYLFKPVSYDLIADKTRKLFPTRTYPLAIAARSTE